MLRDMQSWSDIQPNDVVSNQQFFIPCLKALIGIREYIQMVRNDGDHPRDAIAHAIEIMHKERDCHLLVNWYSTAPPSSADYLDQQLNSYHKSQEVVQTLCLEWVHSLRVSNICFLFHFSAIARGSFDCGGIKNAFYILMKEESNRPNMRYLQVLVPA